MQRFEITPVAYKVCGYDEVPEGEAVFWAVTHYQEDVPRYGSGWFPAYVFEPLAGKVYDYMYRSRAMAEHGLEVYKQRKGLV